MAIEFRCNQCVNLVSLKIPELDEIKNFQTTFEFVTRCIRLHMQMTDHTQFSGDGERSRVISEITGQAGKRSMALFLTPKEVTGYVNGNGELRFVANPFSNN